MQPEVGHHSLDPHPEAWAWVAQVQVRVARVRVAKALVWAQVHVLLQVRASPLPEH